MCIVLVVEWEGVIYVFMGMGDDMDGYEFVDVLCVVGFCFGGGFYSSDVVMDDCGDVVIIDFFVIDEFYVGGFYYGVRGFDYSGKVVGFNYFKCFGFGYCLGIFCSFVFVEVYFLNRG